jgi:hypothetical protein
MKTHECPGCASTRSEVFYEVEGVPANSQLLLTSREEAIAVPRGDVALEFCRTCGLVFNGAFDPGLVAYPSIVENFHILEAFQQRLAHQLIERYALHNKDILEIGCGRGEFLALLCKLGTNHGIGLDPSHVPDPQVSLAGIDATFGCELFGDDTVVAPTDLVCSRMLLEQIADPAHFLGLVRRAVDLRKGARLFLQLSNVLKTLTHQAFWEIHSRRCSYFSPCALHRLLRVQGFTVGDIWVDFDGQYLIADAAAQDTTDLRPDENVENIANLADLVAGFERACKEKQAMWCELLGRLADTGKRIAVWGAGAQAVSFLTTLAVGDEVGYVVVADPRRQGKYTPGTGHKVFAPDAMIQGRPDVMIVLDAPCAFEIQELLARTDCTPTLLIA